MDIARLFLELLCAFLGGALAASLGALGGFVLFGLVGVVGFLAAVITGDAHWLAALAGSVLLRPSSCFLGGVVAAAWARRRGYLRCGKDIGRPLLEFRRAELLLAGGLGGTVGWLVNLALDAALGGRVDTVGLAVCLVPLVLKQAWDLRRSSDCEGRSHAVLSPYRFFERLASPRGKVVVCLLASVGTASLALLLVHHPVAGPYAGLAGFCLSAFSLGVLFLGIPLPATHHFTGPAGAAVMVALPALRSGSALGALTGLLCWAAFAGALGLAASEVLGRLFFDNGDIHVDPPAMGIVASTAVVLSVLPASGVFALGLPVQCAVALVGIAACILLPRLALRGAGSRSAA